MSRRRTALKPYPGGQTRRQTEEHGDLNVYNRMYQFYNYHADKDILIDEMCRGLILSLLRISGGSVEEYDEPLGWTAPYWQDHCAHHHAIVFHMKDQRRHSATFAKTLSSFSGDSMGSEQLLPSQFDADHKVSHTAVPTWVQLHDASGEMKSMAEVASDLAACIKIWIESQTFGGAEDTEEAVRGLDLVPSRLQLLKRCIVSGNTSYEIVVDDREFEASKVDVAAYTTVTMQNVTPASGDSLMTGDPLSSDTINHVPLKGKMYTFSGPVPKVWDRHRAELQHLFRPSFFEKGRYLLPNSKLHDETMDDFRTFPRGRHIWSNCVAEDRITFRPGSSQKLKLEYRMKTSVRDFFHKFRNDDISSSKLGRCVCLALEPQIRRQHVGQPISAVLPKRLWRDGVVNSAVQYEPYMWAETPEIGPNGLSTGKKVITKVVRQVFTLDTSVVPTESNTNPATAELWWTDGTIAVKTAGGVTFPPSNSMEPLKWDSITRNMLDSHPQLAHFVSKGDPIMFNVQINRLYTASSLLKNYTRLGADKTGVKRKHQDKMYSNMGDLSFARAQQLGDVYKDHNLQSATAVGVAPLILEGDDKNTMVTVNVAAEEQAFQNALMAMDADTSKAGLQLDIVNGALNELSTVIDVDGLQVKDQGVIDAMNTGGMGASADAIADAIALKTLTTDVTGNVQVEVVNKQRDWITIGGVAYSSVGIMGILSKARGLGSQAAATMESQISQGMSTFTAAYFLAAVVFLDIISDITSIAHLAYDVNAHHKVTVVGGTVDIGNPGDIAHNVTTGDVNVTVPTATEIATAIAGQTLTVDGAVDIGISEQEGTLLATEIADKLAERTLTVDVDNPHDIAEAHALRTDHTVSVSNHPTAGTGPTASEIASAIADRTLRVRTTGSNTVSVAIPHLEAASLAEDIADKLAEKELQVKTAPGTTLSVDVPDVPTAEEIATAIKSDPVVAFIREGQWDKYTADPGSTDAFSLQPVVGGQEINNQRVLDTRNGAWQWLTASSWFDNAGHVQLAGLKVFKWTVAPDSWFMVSNAVDIGQDVSVQISGDQLVVQAQLPSTIAVTGTVDIGNTPTVNVGNTPDVIVANSLANSVGSGGPIPVQTRDNSRGVIKTWSTKPNGMKSLSVKMDNGTFVDSPNGIYDYYYGDEFDVGTQVFFSGTRWYLLDGAVGP